MKHKAILHRIALFTVILTTGLALTACGGGGGGAAEDDAKDLFLVKFLLVDENGRNLGGSGTTNAYRDTRLLFEFNEAVSFDSVSARTIQIGIPTGTDLLLEAVGRFEQGDSPNQVIFNPTFTKNNVGTVPDNPLGLNPNAVYSVEVPDVLSTPKTVQNKDGDGIVHSFSAAFETSSDYIQNYVQPEVLSTTPKEGDTDVGANADILFTFNVPMKPDSFRLGDTVLVIDADAKRQVLGTLRFSADARVVTFRPVFGYGKGPTRVTVRVSTAVTNLPGNPIPKEILFTFTSVHDATQPDFADIQEVFDDTDYEDSGTWSIYPLAAWDQGVTTGYLAGVRNSGTLTISRGTNSYNYEPWGIPNFNMQWQGLYLSSEMGTARTLTGFDWYKWSYSNITVSNVVMQMGHNTSGALTTNFTGNYSDTPQNIRTSSTYSITNNPSFAWVVGPSFTSQYKYNGSDNLILEINHAGGNVGYPTYGAGLWRVATGESVQKTAYTTSRGTSPVTWNYNYDIRYQYFIDESEARSLWYDAYDFIPQIVGGAPLPQYLGAVISPITADQPVGTITTIDFQGAHADVNAPDTADENNSSDWESELQKLSGYRFIRFRVYFQGNTQTQQQAQIDSIVLPFIYF